MTLCCSARGVAKGVYGREADCITGQLSRSGFNFARCTISTISCALEFRWMVSMTVGANVYTEDALVVTMQAVVPPVVNFSCRAFRISLRSDFPDGQNT